MVPIAWHAGLPDHAGRHTADVPHRGTWKSVNFEPCLADAMAQFNFLPIKEEGLIESAHGAECLGPDHERSARHPVDRPRDRQRRQRHPVAGQKPRHRADRQRRFDFARQGRKAEHGLRGASVVICQRGTDDANRQVIVEIVHHRFDGTGFRHGVGIEKVQIVGAEVAADDAVDDEIVAVTEAAVATGFDQFGVVDVLQRRAQYRDRIVRRLIVDDKPGAPGVRDLPGREFEVANKHFRAAIIHGDDR